MTSRHRVKEIWQVAERSSMRGQIDGDGSPCAQWRAFGNGAPAMGGGAPPIASLASEQAGDAFHRQDRQQGTQPEHSKSSEKRKDRTVELVGDQGSE